VFGLMMRNAPPERAARSSIFLAATPELAGVTGRYYDTNSKPVRWPAPVLDAALRLRLWEKSLALVGLPFVASPASRRLA
jgi:hypothetical protein